MIEHLLVDAEALEPYCSDLGESGFVMSSVSLLLLLLGLSYLFEIDLSRKFSKAIK